MAPHLSIPSSEVCEASCVPQSQPQSVKSRKIKQKKHLKNSPAIKMCNTKVDNNGIDIKCYGASQSPVKDTQCCKTERVPPLPLLTEDILLAKAVESLNISSQNPSRALHKRRNKKKQCIPAESKENIITSHSILVENKDYLISPVNPVLCVSGNSESPSGQTSNVCSPQRCGACGLEFHSVESLSQHLLRHIYEGMYAAQWLTQAMTLVSQQQEQNVSQHQVQTSTRGPQDIVSITQQEQQYASILQQQSMVSIPRHQEQYASIILQPASTQQPLQLQGTAFLQPASTQQPLQQQETTPTIYTQTPLTTPTLHTHAVCAQDETFTYETNRLEERKNINKKESDVETEYTALHSPLIQQDKNSHELSSTRKLSNHSVMSQC